MATAEERRTNSSESVDGERTNLISAETNQPSTCTQRMVLMSCLTAQFLSNVCASLPAPFLPSLDETHNIQSDITGWVIGLLPLTQLFVCPFYGKLVAYVKVKTMLIVGLLVTGGFTVLFGMLDYVPVPDETDDTIDVLYLVLEIVIRIIQSLGAGSILIAAMTLLTTTFTENTTSILGYSQTAVGLGYMCGPAIGSGLYKAGGFAAAFSGVGVILVIVAIVGWFILPLDDVLRTEESSNQPSYKTVLSNINTVLALLLTAFIGTLFSSIEPILEPELREQYGLKEEISALTFLIGAITYTMSAPLVGIALDKVSWLTSLQLMIVGFILNTINFLFMGPCPLFINFYRPLWLLLVTLAMMGIAISFVLVPSLDLLEFNSYDPNSDEEFDAAADKSTKAMLSGLWSSAYALGDFIGPTYSGIMAENFGFAWTMTSFAFVCFLAACSIILINLYKFFAQCFSKRQRNSSSIASEESLPLLS